MRRVESDEHYIGEIPLKKFQGVKYREKHYLSRAKKIVLKGIQHLTIQITEPIHICSGYILSDVRRFLNNKGYIVNLVKIVGATQELAELEYKKSLVRLGVGDLNEVTKMRSYNKFLNWVLEDLRTRERFVKTGWTSWIRIMEKRKK